MPNKGSAFEQLIRLHELVRLLTEQGERGATLNEIRDKVYDGIDESEAFNKKFLRDRKALEEIFSGDAHFFEEEYDGVTDESDVKVFRKKGRYYIKSKYWFMLPMKIEKRELLSLVTGVKLAGDFIKPLKASAESLWNKLKKQFPGSEMKKGERLSEAISLAMPVSDFRPDREVFQKAIDAIDEKRVLGVGQYEDGKGKKYACTISPHALFFKYHAWYLIGISPEKNKTSPAVFRLNRIKAVELRSSENFIECPYSPEELRNNIELDFDPYNPDKEYQVKLRITGDFAGPVMETEWYGGENKKEERDPNGERIVHYEVKLKGLERITLWIMRALDCVEVLEPQELREEIDRRVSAYLKRGGRAAS